MKKMSGFVFAFVLALATMAAAVETAAEIPAPEPILAEPVRAAEAAEPEKALTPAEKLAVAKGISVEEAREVLLAAGLDPDAVPMSEADAAGYVEGEDVELKYVNVWLRDEDGARLVEVYQGHGKYRKGDRQYLFACAKRVRPVTDINGMSDGSSSLWSAMGSQKKRIVYGMVVSSQRTMNCIALDGKSRKVWFNILIDYRGRTAMDDADTNKQGGGWLLNGKGGNLREGFDDEASDYIFKTPQEWYDEEKDHGHDVKKDGYPNGGDPSYFAIYLAKPGEVVDAEVLCDKLLLAGAFTTKTSWLPEKPVFAAGKPTLHKLDQKGNVLPERTNTGKVVKKGSKKR